MATLSTDSWTTIASGTFSMGGAPLTYALQAKLSSQSIANNTSKVATRAKVTLTGSMSSYNVHMSCTGCTPYDGNNSTIYYFSNNSYPLGEGSTTVNHSSNGSGSVTITGSCTGNLGMSISLSGSAELPKINRISTITSFNAFTIEDGLSFSYTDYLANKTLSLDVKLGSTTVRSETYTSVVGAHSASITFTQTELTAIYNAMSTSAKLRFASATSAGNSDANFISL